MVAQDDARAAKPGAGERVFGAERALDEEGKPFELSPDPMNDELQAILKDVELGKPETYQGQLKPVLANANIFGIDLYEAGIGELIEKMFTEEIEGPGAVRRTLQKYLG